MTLSTLGQLAVDYAKSGWYVFPIARGQKDPPLVRWGKERSTDIKQIKKWWTEYPEANIGIATGPSGLFVLDLDIKNDKDGVAELELLELMYGELPPTLTAKTPSGGRHLIYAGEAGSSVSKLGPGIDVRSTGGYILAPGSKLLGGGGMYRFDKSWGAKVKKTRDFKACVTPLTIDHWAIMAAGASNPEASEKASAIAVDEVDTEAFIRWGKQYLRFDARPAIEGEGGDNHTYSVALVLREKGLSKDLAYDLMLHYYNDRCSPPWEPEELAVKVENAYKYANINALGGDTAIADFSGEMAAEADGEESEGEPPTAGRQRDADGQLQYTGFLDEWIWIAKLGLFVRRKDQETLIARNFDSLYNYMIDKGSASDMIFRSKNAMRKFMKIDYRPLSPEFCGDVYNTWRSSGVVPVEGDSSIFDEHMEYLFPDAHDRQLVMCYLAWLVQKPDDRIMFSLVLQGKSGTGKSAIARLMASIIGLKNTVYPTNDEIKDGSNSWAQGIQLCIVEELMALGRKEQLNRLKTVITEDVIRINEKFIPKYSLTNVIAFIMLTNHKDALPLDNDDRRYLIIMSKAKAKSEVVGSGSSENRSEAEDYFDRLFAWVKGTDGKNGPGIVLGKLLEYDLEALGFNGKGKAPITEGRSEMVRASMSDVETWIVENFEMSNFPFQGDLISVDDVIRCMPPELRRSPRLNNAVARCLRENIMAERLGQHRLREGKRVILWSIRRHELVAALDPPERSMRYLKQQSDSTEVIQDFEEA